MEALYRPVITLIIIWIMVGSHASVYMALLFNTSVDVNYWRYLRRLRKANAKSSMPG